MALPSVSSDKSPKFFKDNGYFYEEDEEIGNLVTELERRGLAETFDGFEIAKPKLLGNTNARPILEPFLRQPDVQLCITLGEDPNHRFVFSLQPGQKDRIIVHMWSSRIQAELSDNSHLDPPTLEPLKGASAANGLLEVARAALKKRGSLIPIEMKKGGIAIHDRRFAFGIITGSTITYDLRNTEDTAEDMPKRT